MTWETYSGPPRTTIWRVPLYSKHEGSFRRGGHKRVCACLIAFAVPRCTASSPAAPSCGCAEAALRKTFCAPLTPQAGQTRKRSGAARQSLTTPLLPRMVRGLASTSRRNYCSSVLLPHSAVLARIRPRVAQTPATMIGMPRARTA